MKNTVVALLVLVVLFVAGCAEKPTDYSYLETSVSDLESRISDLESRISDLEDSKIDEATAEDIAVAASDDLLETIKSCALYNETLSDFYFCL